MDFLWRFPRLGDSSVVTLADADVDVASAAPSASECPFDGAASGTGMLKLFKSLPSSNVPGSSSSSIFISLVSAVSELIALCIML